MSIFKSTFKPFVVRQISTRQNLLAQQERGMEFSKYVSGKAPWVRMTSFVDYNNSSDLAKKYILSGGTLYKYNVKSADGKSTVSRVTARYGVGGDGASYGGDLSSTQYGPRPMPGISQVTTRSLGAYGSLTEATVKFYAWDVQQLEELSILFLRPGYKVLLEWGWSLYLDTSVQGETAKERTNSKTLNTNYSTFSIENMPFATIAAFDKNITQDIIYDKLETLRHQYSGNYDGVLGSIRNFEYSLLPNGAYECTTVLISIGDVIDTIKMNDTIGVGVPSKDPNAPVSSLEIKSQFEQLFDAYCKLSPTNTRGLKSNAFIASIDADIKSSDAPFIDTNIYTTVNPIGVSQIIPVSDYSPLDARYNHYIQFAYLLQIFNSYKNLFSDKDQKQIDIEIPCNPTRKDTISNGLCQASYNSVSINPNVVLIKNPKATLFTDKNGTSGFIPPVYNIESPVSLSGFKDYLYSNTNLGIIGNLYISIGKIIALYKQLAVSSNGYVYLGTFLSKLLEDVSFSLGSINDFDKYVNDNKVCIIDKHYTEDPADANVNSKFKINILGNSSIVRQHKINSKIFPSQASMIAIAAQSRENVASVQTSTYTYLNEGLTDRLFGKTLNEKDSSTTDEQRKKNIVNQIASLIQFVKDYVLDNKNLSAFNEGNLATINGYLNSLLVEIDGGTDYKAVIPISVELTIDGLSGLTIGEIFTVDKNVLPKDYKQKSIGFIVTGVSNEIKTNGWETTIQSQICILDQASKQIRSKAKADAILASVTAFVNANITDNQKAAKFYNILMAISADYFGGDISLDASGNIVSNKSLRTTSEALRRNPISYTSTGVSITAEDLFAEFSTLLQSYKKADPQQLYYLGFPIRFFKQDIIEELIKDPLIGSPLATVGGATIDVDTFDAVIKGNDMYQALPAPYKSLFDSEYLKTKNEFTSVLNEKASQDLNKNILKSLGNVIGSNSSIQSQRLKKQFVIRFNIVDIKDLDPVTGAIPNPIPTYQGYRILAFTREINTNEIEF